MSAPTLAARLDGPATEREIAVDLARRAVPVAPVLAAVASLVWGWAGLVSVSYATALVVVNFLLAAALLSWSARISLAVMMAAALGGYVVRLALIVAAVLPVIRASWIEPIPLGATLIVSHLGLLLWEMRYVSATLAYPGLRPDAHPPITSRLPSGADRR